MEATAIRRYAVGEIVVETIHGWERTDTKFHVVTARTPCTVTLARIPSVKWVETGECSHSNYWGHVIPGPADAVVPGVPLIRKRTGIADGWEYIRSGRRSLFGSSFARWNGKPAFISRAD